ncbi:hypothetical protein DV515_00014696 [Chloebia gouldiae]|uniref:Uncharacterized protein n=1 Tax=Chloebia gouldiae TaxID=44316 RepID=A0A3L8RYJ8_CHLGU|nr:hypothetical protein DV515_00014696 [Chloebia gouldiae]
MPCQQTTELWESKPPKLIPALHSKCVPERSVLQKGQGGKFSSLGKNRWRQPRLGSPGSAPQPGKAMEQRKVGIVCSVLHEKP